MFLSQKCVSFQLGPAENQAHDPIWLFTRSFSNAEPQKVQDKQQIVYSVDKL